MASKKDLIIAVLATFCLTATLFTVVPIRSQNTGGYDPWKDLNDDGVIDSTDLGMLGTSWATTGDPTKNVNVTNWPTQQPEPSWKIVQAYQCLRQYINVSWDSYGKGWADGTDWMFSGGYSKMFVYFNAINISHTQSTDVTKITLSCINWGIKKPDGSWMSYCFDHLGEYLMNYTVIGIIGTSYNDYDPHYYPAIEVKGPWVGLAFGIISSTQPEGWVLLEVYVYFRNE
ncbi:MAG: hypothetical protein ACPLYF_04915 [Fervidobacterium sp.]